ncbi:MAG: hypothetical protein WCJ71_04680 [Candidatus Omnitrophota bacterium]
MKKIFFCSMAGIIFTMLVVGAPQAHAVFGIRAARTALAARKARELTSSTSTTPEEAYAQEKARFEKPTGTVRTTGNSASSSLKGKQPL